VALETDFGIEAADEKIKAAHAMGVEAGSLPGRSDYAFPIGQQGGISLHG
jgi:hypothetical protein